VKITTLQLKQAGFRDDDIISFVDLQRPLLKSAGFSDYEIYSAFGIKNPNSNVIKGDLIDDGTNDKFQALINQDLTNWPSDYDRFKGDSVTTSNKFNASKDANKVSVKDSERIYEDDSRKEEISKIDQQQIIEKIKKTKEEFPEKKDQLNALDQWRKDNFPNVMKEDFLWLGDQDSEIAYEALQGTLWKEEYRGDLYAPKFLDTRVYQYYSASIFNHIANRLKLHDDEIINLMEMASMFASMESDNRSIFNSDGYMGLWQFDKKSMKTAINRFKNIYGIYDVDIPEFIIEAEKHLDMTRLFPDEQAALFLANLSEIPPSEKYNREGSDRLLKLAAQGNVDAMTELYLNYHHAMYKENDEGVQEIATDEATLKRWNRIQGFFNRPHEYEMPQVAMWANDAWLGWDVIEKIEKFKIGRDLVEWSGGKGYHNVWSKGKAPSVFGLSNLVEKKMLEDPTKPFEEIMKEQFMWEGQRFSREILAEATTLVNDIPFFAAGCFAASPTLLTPAAPAFPVVCMAGAFALPESLRDAYIRTLEEEEVSDIGQFWDQMWSIKTAKTAGKAGLTGALTATAGKVATKIGFKTIPRLGVEVATMVSVGSFLEGRVPSRKDFVHAAILIGGFHSATKITTSTLMKIYRKFGRGPYDVLKDAAENADIKRDLIDGKIPEEYESASDSLITGMEDATGTKILNQPKFAINEEVNIDPSNQVKGTIVQRDVVKGEKVLIVEVGKGENKYTVQILEKNARKSEVDSRETKTVEEKEIKRNITILEKKLKLAEEKKAKFVEEKEPPEVKEKEKKDAEVEEELLDIPTFLRKQAEKIKEKPAKKAPAEKSEADKLLETLREKIEKLESEIKDPNTPKERLKEIAEEQKSIREQLESIDKEAPKEKDFEQQLNKTINDLKLEIEKENEKLIVEKEKTVEDFKTRQEEGEFNKDIVEFEEPLTDYKSSAVSALADAKKSHGGGSIKIVSNDGLVASDGKLLWVNKFYPKLKKAIDRVKITEKMGNASELISRVFKGFNKKYKNIEIIFGINKDGASGFKSDVLIGKIKNGPIIAFMRKGYTELKRFTDKDGKVKEAKVMAMRNDKGIAFLHPETGQLLGMLMPLKINKTIESQAKTYLSKYKPKKDGSGTYYDRYSSRDSETWGEMPEDPANPTPPENNSTWRGLFNSASGLDSIDLVEIIETFLGKVPEAKTFGLSYFLEGLRGFFSPDPARPRVVIARELINDPSFTKKENIVSWMKTIAHELGHLIDFLPEKMLKRGNILGSIATLKGFMDTWISGKADGAKALTKKEINALKKQAEQIAKENEKKTDVEIEKDLKIKPDTITKILTDPKIREWIDPEFYEAFVRLSSALKKLIFKDALKGMISTHIKALVDRINGKPVEKNLSNEAAKIFTELFNKEITKRGLVNKEWIIKELKALSMQWKPWNRRTAKKGYRDYRDGPRELMADFLMAWLLRPQWTKINAPRSFEMWAEYIFKKPELKKIYLDIQSRINAGKNSRLAEVNVKIEKKFIDAEHRIMEALEKRYKNAWQDELGSEVLDSLWWLYKRRGLLMTRGSSPKSPDHVNVIYKWQRNRYKMGHLVQYIKSIKRDITEPLAKRGYNQHTFGRFLLLRYLSDPKGKRKDLINMLGIAWVEKEIPNFRSANELYEAMVLEHPYLDVLAEKFYEIREKLTFPRLKESGVWDREFMTDVENNKTYVTMNVVDFIIKRIEKYGGETVSTSHLKEGKGSFKDIQNVFTATVEKDLVLIAESYRNEAVGMTIEYLNQYKGELENLSGLRYEDGTPMKERIIEPVEYNYTYPKIKVKVRGGTKTVSTKVKTKVKKPPAGMEVIGFIRDGKAEYWYINKVLADGIKKNPLEVGIAWRFMNNTNIIFKKMFTEYNPPFWLFNFGRDTHRAVRNLPHARYFDVLGPRDFRGKKKSIILGRRGYLKHVFGGFIPAIKSIFGDGTELTRMMEREGYLISVDEGYHGMAGTEWMKMKENKGTLEDHQMERMLKKYSQSGNYGTFFEHTFVRFFDWIGNLGRIVERMQKIGGKTYTDNLIERGVITMSKEEQTLLIQAQVGSPDFLRTGKMHVILNGLLLYSNAIKEGWRGDVEAFRQRPKEIFTKWVMYNAMPKVMMKMATLGIFGIWTSTIMNGVSEWDKTNYIILPVGITPDGRAVYIRVPQDESARVFSGLLWKIMNIEDGGLKTPVDLLAYLGEEAPSTAPIFPLMADVLEYMGGWNPTDEFRHTKAINEQIFDAGGKRKFKEFMKFLFNNYGGSSVYRFESNNLREITLDLEKKLKYPIAGRMLGRFLKIGHHVKYYELKEDFSDKRKMKAKYALDFRDAMELITQDKTHLLNKRHQEAMKWFSENITSDARIQKYLISKGANAEIIDMLIAAQDTQERLQIIRSMLSLMRDIDLDPFMFMDKEKTDIIPLWEMK